MRAADSVGGAPSAGSSIFLSGEQGARPPGLPGRNRNQGEPRGTVRLSVNQSLFLVAISKLFLGLGSVWNRSCMSFLCILDALGDIQNDLTTALDPYRRRGGRKVLDSFEMCFLYTR